jgi:type II secretory pathway pseudopilin PulG
MRGKQTGRVVVNVEGTRTAAYDGVPAALGRTSPAPAPAQQRSSGQLMVPTDDAGPLVTGGNYSFPAAGVPDYEAAELERMLFKSGATLGRLAYDGINPQAAAAAAFAAGNRHRASDPNMGGRPYDNRAAATMRTLLPDDMAVGSDSWGRGGGGAAAASAAAMMAAHQTQQQQQAEDAAALMSVIMTAARVTNQKLPMLPANARGKKAAVPDPSVLAQFEPIIGHTVSHVKQLYCSGTCMAVLHYQGVGSISTTLTHSRIPSSDPLPFPWCLTDRSPYRWAAHGHSSRSTHARASDGAFISHSLTQVTPPQGPCYFQQLLPAYPSPG